MPDGGLTSEITATLFYSFGASRKKEQRYFWEQLRSAILETKAKAKADLPWIKLARFGSTKTEKGSLRHNANLIAITGIEADYDGEQVTPAEAVARLEKACVKAMVYTSPSHSAAAPRWRVLCPVSTELAPEHREHLVGRLNGVLGGILAAESWTLSQCYYFGRVGDNPDHLAELVDGRYIDLCDDLNRGWIGKPATIATGSGKPGNRGRTDEAGLLAEIVSGDSYHTAATRLAGSWAKRNVPYMVARKRLEAAFEAVPEEQRDGRWKARRDDLDRCLQDIYGKEVGKKERGEKRFHKRADVGADIVDCELTEDGAAVEFAKRHHGALRYCHDTGRWFMWTGTHWQQNRIKVAFTWARQMVRELNRNHDVKTKAITGKASFAGAVERFAQADSAFAVTAETWDRDPWLLGTPGGVVDLRTGRLRMATREDYITKITSVAPAYAGESRAACPAWLSFLKQATNDDAALIAFLQQWCGYCLTGITREHALLFIYGPGGNGKSVLLNTLSHIMGDYCRTAPMDAFTASPGDRHPTDIAMLRGARLVTATETEEGRAWAEARIKQMTGGDPVTARFMRQDFFTFIPQFKITIAGNHKPTLRNVDDAARRRFNIVPFLHKPKTPDLDLEEKLKAEWPAILRWMIEGCLGLQRAGLQRPKIVIDATAEYFEAQDTIGRWLADRAILDPSLEEKPGRLVADCRAWAVENGEAPPAPPQFRSAIECMGGIRYATVKGSQTVKGVGLRPPRRV